MMSELYPIFEKVKENCKDAVLVHDKRARKTQKYLAIFGVNETQNSPTAITKIIPFKIPYEIHRAAMPRLKNGRRSIFSTMEYSTRIEYSYNLSVEGERDKPNFLYIDCPLETLSPNKLIAQFYLRHFLGRKEIVDFNLSYQIDNLPNESFVLERDLLDKYDPERKFRNWGINSSIKNLEKLALQFLDNSGEKK